MLRHPTRIVQNLRSPDSRSLLGALAIISLFASGLYGIVVGTFSGGSQLWAAPIKIAGGLLLSGLICLPSLYIFGCLGGSQARFVEACGLVAGLLALMSILLLGFAPVAWIFSQSTDNPSSMGALHLIFWLIAMWFALGFLRHGFAQLGPHSTKALNLWTAIFVVVMLQMTTTLRPILGKSDRFLAQEKKFFLGHWVDCLEKGAEKR